MGGWCLKSCETGHWKYVPAGPSARWIALQGIHSILVDREASILETVGVELVAAVAPVGVCQLTALCSLVSWVWAGVMVMG